jgi:hypothetical protein
VRELVQERDADEEGDRREQEVRPEREHEAGEGAEEAPVRFGADRSGADIEGGSVHEHIVAGAPSAARGRSSNGRDNRLNGPSTRPRFVASSAPP